MQTYALTSVNARLTSSVSEPLLKTPAERRRLMRRPLKEGLRYTETIQKATLWS